MAKKVPFFIGDNLGTTMTPKLYFWMRLISGKSFGFIYYLIEFFSALKNMH
jgi:hypothetical protein